jgi:hypothetical protein
VYNGTPLLSSGLSVGNTSSYLVLSGETLQLYVNDEIRQTWTTVLATAAPVFIADGVPMGLLLGITYQT